MYQSYQLWEENVDPLAAAICHTHQALSGCSFGEIINFGEIKEYSAFAYNRWSGSHVLLNVSSIFEQIHYLTSSKE